MQSLDAKCVAQLQGTSKRCEPAALFIIFLKSMYDECCKPIILSLRIQNNSRNVCEERITHTELDVYQSWTNLKIDFLLLSRTFLPVGVAYKTTDNHGFS